MTTPAVPCPLSTEGKFRAAARIIKRKVGFRVRRAPTVAVDVVSVMKRTANPTPITARTPAVDTKKTMSLRWNPCAWRIIKTAFRVCRSLIVATDVVKMMKASANPLSITVMTLAADTRKSMASQRNSRARTIHKVQAVSILRSREFFD